MRKLMAVLLTWAFSISVAAAQSFPDRTVRIIVPVSPAGITDIAARMLATRLSALWGVSVIVENRPGGGGSIGVASVARAAPDGYTLLMTTNGELALNPVINQATKYNAARDFTPLAMVTNNPMIVVANSNSPYKTLADLVTAAKAQPDKISWASPGVGTWNHLTGEWLWSETGIKLVHVPYRGGGPAGTAIAAGDVPVGIVAISSALPHMQAGRIRVLAITTDKRSKIDPSWPTVAESNVPGFNSMQWVGLFAIAGTDPKIREKIAADTLAVLADPAVKDHFNALGIEVIGQPGTEATKQLERDTEIARKVSRDANIHID